MRILLRASSLLLLKALQVSGERDVMRSGALIGYPRPLPLFSLSLSDNAAEISGERDIMGSRALLLVVRCCSNLLFSCKTDHSFFQSLRLVRKIVLALSPVRFRSVVGISYLLIITCPRFSFSQAYRNENTTNYSGLEEISSRSEVWHPSEATISTPIESSYGFSVQ